MDAGIGLVDQSSLDADASSGSVAEDEDLGVGLADDVGPGAADASAGASNMEADASAGAWNMEAEASAGAFNMVADAAADPGAAGPASDMSAGLGRVDQSSPDPIASSGLVADDGDLGVGLADQGGAGGAGASVTDPLDDVGLTDYGDGSADDGGVPDDLTSSVDSGMVDADSQFPDHGMDDVSPSWGHAMTAPGRASDARLALTEAATLIKAGENKQAADLLKRLLIQGQLSDPRADYLLGVAAFRSGDLATAVGAFRHCLAANPVNAAAQYGLGTALLAQGDAEGARRAFADALHADPGSSGRACAVGRFDQ